MSAALRYSLDPDRDAVAVTIACPGSAAVTRMVESAELRRFAWAVLNDLDPEAVDAVSPAPAPVPFGFMKWAVVVALQGGPLTAPELAVRLGMSREIVSVRLAKLKSEGCVTHERPFGLRAGNWTLTEFRRRKAALAEVGISTAQSLIARKSEAA